MDRRSWLWRRKSSEKSPSGETDSSAGSISSHSERFSDDQALPNHNIHSPEVTSKAAPGDEEFSDTVKTLSDKLSEALLNIRAKDELVKQHAKVAEEAVSGWEKAETEVVALKKQVEVITHKNSALEERVGHLDGALKECLRQLRQAREEQEHKIHEAIVKRSSEWESTKSALENEVNDLRCQLQTANTDALTSTFPDLCIKLEAAQKENSVLRNELLSREEELKLRTSERDLSTSAAETASKQHLESIKKVAKLEAECRRLKMLTRRAAPFNDHRSATASSVYVESFADSQSDCERLSLTDDTCKFGGLESNDCEAGHSNSWASALMAELDQFKSGKTVGRNFMSPADEIDLMDDFLEMERLAALSEAEKGSFADPGGRGEENLLKTELEAMVNRTAQMQEKLEKIEEEKTKLKMALTECQGQLKASTDKLEETQVTLMELKSQLSIVNQAKRAAEAELDATKIVLKNSAEDLEKAEVCIVELQTQLAMTNEAKTTAEIDVKITNEKMMKSKARLDDLEVKIAEIHTKLATASKEKYNSEAELQATKIEKEAAESRLKVVEVELKSLQSKVHNLEADLQKEQAFSAEAVSNLQKLENEILIMKSQSQPQLDKSANLGDLKFNQDKELAMAASKFAECQKTIASLGQQLTYLATMQDLLIDSEHQL